MADHLAELRELLTSNSPGPIDDAGDIESLLSSAWDELDGSNDTAMSEDKLFGRIENFRWDPPELCFEIERHGGTVNGSIYAELYSWSVNVEKGTAGCSPAGRRLLGERQKAFEFKAVTDEICTAITNGHEDERLDWKDAPKSKVQVMMGKIIPERSASKPTIQGRRQRLSKYLEEKLNECGWEKLSRQHLYGRVSN